MDEQRIVRLAAAGGDEPEIEASEVQGLPAETTRSTRTSSPTGRLPKNQLKVRCELCIRASSWAKFARAMTTVPGSRTAARPPTWSQCECVRMT